MPDDSLILFRDNRSPVMRLSSDQDMFGQDTHIGLRLALQSSSMQCAHLVTIRFSFCLDVVGRAGAWCSLIISSSADLCTRLRHRRSPTTAVVEVFVALI